MVEFLIKVNIKGYNHVAAFFGPSTYRPAGGYICLDVRDDSPWIIAQGKRILCTHRAKDGTFEMGEDNLRRALKQTGSDYILCCHPGVAETDLPVLGDWLGVTGLYQVSATPQGGEYVGTLRVVGYGN